MIPGSILYFLGTVALTLGITVWAAGRNTGRAAFYAASSKIGGFQNGLAITGDFLSAGAVLGLVGLYSVAGADVLLFFMAPMAGFCLLYVLVVGPLRRMGRFTLGDVVGSRLPGRGVRLVLGFCSVTTSLINLVAQLLGAGGLISIVFGLPFNLSVSVVGALMTTYVVFGGMLAATWVQIVKAVLLVSAILYLSLLGIVKAGGLASLYGTAESMLARGPSAFSFGALHMDMYSAVSLAVGVIFGIMGLPHLLIRFFTVPDESTARRSLVIATTLMGLIMGAIFFVISPATVAFLTNAPDIRTNSGSFIGGSNMVTLHLARVLGGDVLLGVMGAIAFSTILAGVAGLTVAVSSSTSHDIVAALRGKGLSEKTELLVFRIAAFTVSAAAVGLAILFQRENIAFLIVAGFAVAASTTGPLLLLSIYWPKLTAEGAIAAGIVGLVASVGLIIASPVFWTKILGFSTPLYPSEYPGLISVPLAFATAWIVSTLTRPTTS